MAQDVLSPALAASPDRIALVSPDRAWTYAELATEVSERADALRSAVRRGGAHFFAAGADAAGVVELLACGQIGAAAAPLDPRMTDVERSAAESSLRGVETDAQVILWTSGTTGRPRGVALSYENLRASCNAAAERLELGPTDVWLASLSPAHVGGVALITRSMFLGCTLVASGPFDVELFSEQIDGRRLPAGVPPISHMSLVPTQLLRLLELRGDARPPLTFRCALIGGAHAPPDLVARALGAGWPLALTYGMTEMTSQVATATPAEVIADPGSVGRPLGGVEVRVAGEGEIEVRGPTLATGYVGSSEPLGGEDGWLRTGDLGHLDGAGALWVTGRRADRIVSGGVTVDATHVENVLREHPAVYDVCVVGVPSDEWGESVAAWVVPVEGELDLDELDEHARGRLSEARRPRIWHIHTSVPRNPMGKPDRRRIRAELERGRASAGGAG